MSLDLDAIEARAKAATPGPWVLSEVYWKRPPDQFFRRVCKATTDGEPSLVDVALMPYLPSGKPDPQVEHDFAFVVAAREDIPALVAEVRRLQSCDLALKAVRLAAESEWPAEDKLLAISQALRAHTGVGL